MADLTKAEVAELTADHVLIKGLTLKIAADTEAIKAAAKRIDAKLKKAAKNFADGKTERTRFGVRFVLTSKAGRVAWRSIVESLKGKDFANAEAAKAPVVTTCDYDPESLPR